MSNFWPSGVTLSVQSPLQILEEARSQWEEQSGGLLSLEFVRDDSEEEYIEIFIVSSDRRYREVIFVVVSMPEHPYPCSIVCSDEPRIECSTAGKFRNALEIAMNWSQVRSDATNMLIRIEGG